MLFRVGAIHASACRRIECIARCVRININFSLYVMGVTTTSPRSLHDEALAHLRRRNVRPAQAILRRLQEHDAGSVHCLLLEGHCALIGQGDRASASSLPVPPPRTPKWPKYNLNIT